MAFSAQDVRDHVGGNPTVTFEVVRATDTETLEATPKRIDFGRRRRGPVVKFHYSKYNAFLPPWDQLVSFTLEGDGTAEFGYPTHVKTHITGSLKTVDVCALTCSLS
jgi:hypothetical protein